MIWLFQNGPYNMYSLMNFYIQHETDRLCHALNITLNFGRLTSVYTIVISFQGLHVDQYHHNNYIQNLFVRCVGVKIPMPNVDL